MANLELYDCTLREGEQAAGASFDLAGRVRLFSQLDDFGMDFIELGWPTDSGDVLKSFQLCKKARKNAKIVVFGATCVKPHLEEDAKLKLLIQSKADYACIFGKSHLDQVKKQLQVSPQENLLGIRRSIEFLRKNGMHVFYDAEHFFDAFKEHKDYALATVYSAINGGAERIILCDTNGGTLPSEVEKIVAETYSAVRNSHVPLGVHFHNDSGLALSNALVSLPFVQQIQGTINGIGERVGNLDFSQFIPIYQSKLGRKLDVKSKKLKGLTEFAYRLSGLDIPLNKPFVGNNAFAHKGGVHIDAVLKGARYEHMNPEDYGNQRVFILNTIGGSSGVIELARQLGHKLDKKDPLVRKRIESLFAELRPLEQKGYRLGAIPAEQYMLIEKYFGNFRDFFSITSNRLETETIEGKETSRFFMTGTLGQKPLMQSITVDGGPVDAAYKTLIKMLLTDYPFVKSLKITDFHTSIAKSKAEESTVRTIIRFEDHEKFETVGVDSNMFQSALEAVSKGLKYYLNRRYNGK